MVLAAGIKIDKAKEIAERAHAGKNYGGQPYISHVQKVVLSVTNLSVSPEVIIVAWLHDVLEDSSLFSIEDLAEEFSPSVVNAVDAITKRNYEAYSIYLARVGESPIATTVKLCDVEVNLAESRRLVKKYEQAQQILEAIDGSG